MVFEHVKSPVRPSVVTEFLRILRSKFDVQTGSFES